MVDFDSVFTIFLGSDRPFRCTRWFAFPLLGDATIFRKLRSKIEGIRERTEHLDIFLYPPITEWCSISYVLFTGGRECQILKF